MPSKFPKLLWLDEEFKSVEGWRLYCISNYGRVFMCKRHGLVIEDWLTVSVSANKYGYFQATFSEGQIIKNHRIHVLVALHFIGPRPSGMQCCHNDGNKENNYYKNLRWDSAKSNAADKIKHGASARPRGSKNGMAKLTTEIAKEIKVLRFFGRSEKELAEMFSCSRQTINNVLNDKTYYTKGD